MARELIPSTGFGDELLYRADQLQYKFNKVELGEVQEPIKQELEHFQKKTIRGLMEVGLGFLLQVGKAQSKGSDVVMSLPYNGHAVTIPLDFSHALEKPSADRIITEKGTNFDKAVRLLMRHFSLKNVPDVAEFSMMKLQKVMESEKEGFHPATLEGDALEMKNPLHPGILRDMRKPQGGLREKFERWCNHVRLWVNDVA